MCLCVCVCVCVCAVRRDRYTDTRSMARAALRGKKQSCTTLVLRGACDGRTSSCCSCLCAFTLLDSSRTARSDSHTCGLRDKDKVQTSKSASIRLRSCHQPSWLDSAADEHESLYTRHHIAHRTPDTERVCTVHCTSETVTHRSQLTVMTRTRAPWPRV